MREFLRHNWLVLAVFVAIIASFVVQRNDRQDGERAACQQTATNAREVNARTQSLISLRDGMLAFNAETRRARSDKHGTSYDPHFVAVIDAITPKLKAIQPQKLPVAHC